MPTMKDVAKAAGVSLGTVSNYINRTHPVNRKTAARIAAAIDKLGYVPNHMARSLKSGGTRTIGVVLPNLLEDYYAQIYQALEGRLSDRGYRVELFISHDIAEIEQRCIIDLLEHGICGLFLVTSQPENTEFFERHIILRKLPVVLMDRKIEGSDTNFIYFDTCKTVHRLLNYFSDAERIVLFCGPKGFFCEDQAVIGFGEVSEKRKVVHAMLNKQSAFCAAATFLKNSRPNVIIATSSQMAVGIHEVLDLLSLRDTVLVSFGEDNWNTRNRAANCMFTSREAFRAGRDAAKMLLTELNEPGAHTPKTLILPDNWRIPVSNDRHKVVSSKGEHIKVRVLDTLQTQFFEDMIPYFERTQGIGVSFDKIIGITSMDRLRVICDDSESDVFMYDHQNLCILAQNGVLADITAETNTLDTTAYLKDALDIFGSFDNKYFGLPFMYAPQVLLYRKDFFSDPTIKSAFFKQYGKDLLLPKTWQDFNLVSAFFTKSINPNSPVKWGTIIPAANSECFALAIHMRLWSYGVSVFNRKNEATLNSKNAVRAYQNLLELLSFSWEDNQCQNDAEALDEFLNGKLAMLVTYPPFLSNIDVMHKSYYANKIGVAYVPGKCPIMSGWGLGVAAKSKKRAEAFQFIQWACGEEMANYTTIIAGRSTISKIYETDELISLYPWLPIYKGTYDLAEPITFPILNGRILISQDEVDALLSEGIYAIMDGRQSVEGILEITENVLNDRLNEYSGLNCAVNAQSECGHRGI